MYSPRGDVPDVGIDHGAKDLLAAQDAVIGDHGVDVAVDSVVKGVLVDRVADQKVPDLPVQGKIGDKLSVALGLALNENRRLLQMGGDHVPGLLLPAAAGGAVGIDPQNGQRDQGEQQIADNELIAEAQISGGPAQTVHK